MIRLTVLYTLAPHMDEAAFVRWRLGEHQAENASMPGVLRTDFATVDHVWPPGSPSPYKFMTTAEWPDMESFRAVFYEPKALADLMSKLPDMATHLFLVTEILTETKNV
jgi:hypothetical protein